jgi:hypothetical protein
LCAALAALLVFGWGLAGVYSQQRRRPSRRASNPVRVQPTPTPDPVEPALVSTSEEGQEPTPRRTPGRTRGGAAPEPTPEPLRGTVERLTTTVERLSEDVTTMKTDQRALFDLERLTRAEQRAESLRAQLRDVTDKEFNYQERLAQIEDELQPDAIQRRAAVVGTLNPGSVRDSIQRSLERERDRLRRQLEMITNSRTRLESAVATAEVEVERLRQRVEGADQPQTNTTTTTIPPLDTGPTPTPTPTPTPAEPPGERQ